MNTTTAPAPTKDDTTWRIRATSTQDWDEIHRVDELAFGYTWDPATGDTERGVLDLDRGLLAYDGDEPVGLTLSYQLRLSVPTGREVDTAGVTWVGVVPTHRRRGVLTELMRAQLADLHDRGEPVATLFASEPGIYGRFGYGLASEQYALAIEHGRGGIQGPHDPGLRVRLMTVADARPAVEQVYASVRESRAGMPGRDELWWARCTSDYPSERGKASALRVAVAEDAGRARAYAIFTSTHVWESGSGQNEINVRESLATDAAAAAALWRMLLSTDLTRVVRVSVATDDVLLDLLTELRRAQPRLGDGLRGRLIDLPTALASRTYDERWAGVVDIADRFAPWNQGRWRLSLEESGANCTRTEDPPDLAMDIADLGGAYFGGRSLVRAAAAGRVMQGRPGAAAGLSRAMLHEPGPYCPFTF